MNASKYYEIHSKDMVKWRYWNDESLRIAKESGKLLFITIGYATCHWCHVFQEENFMNPEVADILNTSYVPILVDREDRPDVDAFYMKMAQIMNGGGGWPLNIIAIPTGEPVFISSYLPPFRRDNFPGFIDVISYLRDMWEKDKYGLIQSAEKAMSYLNLEDREVPTEDIYSDTIELISNVYDREYGGFGQEPKFPSYPILNYLITYSQLGNDYTFMVDRTIRNIRYGGIYDQIGYGLFRYAIDRRWQIPHFEKMLYDQAMLLWTLSRLNKIKNNNFYTMIIKEIQNFLDSSMKDSETGLYYSALDADWLGKEGGYYLWTSKELNEALGDKKDLLKNYFNFVEVGEGTLLVPAPGINLSDENMLKLISELKNYRDRKEPLTKDDKILLGFNSLLLKMKLELSPNNISREEIMKFLSYFDSGGGGLYRYIRNGKRQGKGVLEDYAFMLDLLVSSYNYLGDKELLTKAIKISNYINSKFYDYKKGGYFLSEDGEGKLPQKIHDEYDSVYPSGNAMMIWNLERLKMLLETNDYDPYITGIKDRFSKSISRNPIGNISKIEYTLLSSKIYQLRGKNDQVKKSLQILRYPLNFIAFYDEDSELSICGDGKCQIVEKPEMILNYKYQIIY